MSFQSQLTETLTAALPGRVSLPGSEQYVASNDSYFSAFEADLKPSCIAHPSTVDDVATIIKALRPALSQKEIGVAAIKGGGNMAWQGSANVDGGMTIDLRGLKGIQLSSDRKTVSVAAGETWGSVYETLEKDGLIVAGGRVNRLGAVGFLLGGGLSYFSSSRGFSCDSVVNLEVVLASGEVVQANRTTNSDLHRAILGGSNNFGVVTRFDMTVFELPPKIYGGRIMTTMDNLEPLYTAIYDTAMGEHEGAEHVHIQWAVVYMTGMEFAVAQLYEVQGNAENPSIQAYLNVEPKIEQATTLRHDTHAAFCAEQEVGFVSKSRSYHYSITIRPSIDLFRAIYKRFKETLDLLKESVTDLSYFLIMQPITVDFLRKSCEQWPAGSSNSQGLRPEDGPLLTVLVLPTWSSSKDDELMFSETEKLMNDIKTISINFGLDHRYIFPNHSWGRQNILAGYGEERLAELRKAQEKWDPEGLFQTVIGGGYKISKA